MKSVKVRLVFVIGLVGVLLAACQPMTGTPAGPVQYRTLSSLGETYTYSGDDSSVTIQAPTTNTEGSIRHVFWRSNALWTNDQQSCITLNDTGPSVGDPLIQTGLAMRIAPSGPNGEYTKAISIDENVYAGVAWTFWILLWDTSNTAVPHVGLKSFDVSKIIKPNGVYLPPPWHLCARAAGLLFGFKLWVGDGPEPPWTDSTHTFTVGLPQGWDYPGYSGGYVAHLHPGQQATFSDMTSEPLCLEPDMQATDYCQSKLADLGSTTTTVPEDSTTVPEDSTTVPGP